MRKWEISIVKRKERGGKLEVKKMKEKEKERSEIYREKREGIIASEKHSGKNERKKRGKYSAYE